MTVFIASLFLPITVSFQSSCKASATSNTSNGGSSRSSEDSPPASEKQKPNKRVSIDASANLSKASFAKHGSSKSLDLPTRPLLNTLPKTPGATTLAETIFVPQDITRSFNLTLPTKHHKNSASTTSLRSLLRPDIQSPGWGLATELNQPKSQAQVPATKPTLPYRGCAESKPTVVPYYDNLPPVARSSITQPMNQEVQYTSENYTVEPTIIGNGGLFSAVEAVTACGQLQDKTWVGTLGMPVNALDSTVKTNIAEKLQDEYESLVVYVDDNDMEGHYEQYCKRMLYPTLHYQLPNDPKCNDYQSNHYFKYYVAVNQAFADRIIQNYKQGDVIWIHDYHLLLLPAMIRKQLPNAQIGIYMHSAFPSSEIFKCLPARNELLDGMIAANLVGFQMEEHSHHFLQTCSKHLCIEATNKYLILENGRYVHVHVAPMGIDVTSLDQRRQLPDVAQWIKSIRERYSDKRIVLARDKLDKIRGVRDKLLAYEYLLDNYPDFRDDVVLIQIATVATNDKQFLVNVNELAARINNKYSTLAHQPLVFLTQDIDYSQYLALLTIADCLMVTGRCEGMNLSPHEYVVCQDGNFYGQKHGPVILSAFTGAASVFGEDAVQINPWYFQKTGRLLKQALEMDEAERERRWTGMFNTVKQHSAAGWFESCITALETAWQEHSVRETSAIPRLSVSKLYDEYAQSFKRLLLIDYEGTLSAWGPPSDTIVPTPKRIIDILNELTKDENNAVYLTSQRMPEELEQQFRQIAGLGLIAENGAFLRDVGSDEWINLVDLDRIASWKSGVKKMLTDYALRLRGSKVEELHSGLIFRYDKVEDQAAGAQVAGDCISFINDACSGQRVATLPLEQGLYVMDSDANKASAAADIVDHMLAVPDFILAIGDSREDEHVFHWAHDMKEKGVKHICTVVVGQRASEASTTLQGPVGVLSTLEKLAQLKKK